MPTIEERLKALEEDSMKQKNFRKRFNSITSLEVAKTENGRVALRDNGNK